MNKFTLLCLTASPALLFGCMGAIGINQLPPPPEDSGVDAALDAGFDAGRDATVPGDAGSDAIVPLDAGFDATTRPDAADSGWDAPAVDASGDARSDAGYDGGYDAASDAGYDAGSDGGYDAGYDSGYDGGFDAGPPQCANLQFDASATPVPGANQGGGQNVPAGATPNGHTILVQHGGCSSGLSLFIADMIPDAGTYTTRAVPTLAGADVSVEENVTLEADGLAIIALNTTHTGFVVSARSAFGLTDFGTPAAGDFSQIVATGSQKFWAPTISSDGLAFYYVVQSDTTTANNGIYESVRTSTSVPFPLGTRMPALIQGLAQYVNGVSADRLAIFLEESSVFAAVVLTRTKLSDPFTNPLAPSAAPVVPGLRTRPLAGCGQLVGTCSPTPGCSSEQVCTWGAQ